MQTTRDDARLPEPAGAPPPETPADAPAPVARPRLRGVDLARGLAVLGMFAAHIAMAPTFVASEPATWGGLVHGRSSILFATLAGVSVALMTGRTEPPAGAALVTARLVVLVRAVCLFAVGGLVQLLSSPVAVILEYYAVLLVLCVPLLRWRPRSLLLLAGGIALVVPSLRVLFGDLQMSGTSWLGTGGELGTLALSGTYPAAVWAAFVVAGLAVGRCDLGAARVRRALVLGGVALAVVGYGGSWALTQALPSIDPSTAYGSSTYSGTYSSLSEGSVTEYRPPQYVAGTEVDLTGFGCRDDMDGTYYCTDDSGPYAMSPDDFADGDLTWTGGSEDSGATPTPDQFLGASAHSGTTPEVLGSGGVALAVLGACLWLADALGRRRWLVVPLVAVGSMPLTAYCAHIAGLAVTTRLSMGDPSSVDAGYGSSWLVGGWALWAVFAGAALLGCTLWARFAGRGPLERLLALVARRAVRA